MRNLNKVTLLILLSALHACSWDIKSVNNPDDIVDPRSIETQTGVISLYKNIVNRFSAVFAGGGTGAGSSFVYATALAGDELLTDANPLISLRRLGIGDGIISLEVQAPWYNLHATRLHIDQTVGLAKKFSNQLPDDYLVHMYAMRGYISIFIGELYCSGVAFNRAIYGGDLEFNSGIPTQAVFERAIADFDSALSLNPDSARFSNLAKMGKARALMNLNRYNEASALVGDIPTSFRFQIQFASTFTNFVKETYNLTMTDRLGTNGLDYFSAGRLEDRDGDGTPERDPRMEYTTSSAVVGQLPVKSSSVSDPINLTDGLEARLIEAEALLRDNDTTGWAGKLNNLRRSGLSIPMDTISPDSTLSAGPMLREDVMFRERAFWLYVTGRRFGDMRRKVRQYRRSTNEVFPVGLHPTLNFVDKVFSGNPNLAPPQSEVDNNPKYSGCFDRNA